MKVLFWNIRGIGNHDSRLVLKKLLALHKPDFLFIAEPWISFDALPVAFFSNFHFKLFAVNNRNQLLPNLWCLCAK